MADNVELNPGSGGDIIAADDVNGVKHLRAKIEIGVDGAAADVHSRNPLPVHRRCSTATTGDKAAATTSTQLLAANPNRKGFSIFNDSTALLTIKMGTDATTNPTAILQSGGWFEDEVGYPGEVTGIWVSATGRALVTEYS